MNKEEILTAIKRLSMSQGLYCRVMQQLDDEILTYLESKNFSDVLDLVMFIEG